MSVMIYLFEVSLSDDLDVMTTRQCITSCRVLAYQHVIYVSRDPDNLTIRQRLILVVQKIMSVFPFSALPEPSGGRMAILLKYTHIFCPNIKCDEFAR